MSGDNTDEIFIRATSKRNGITSVVIGLAGLLFSFLWLSFAPDWLFLAGVFITSASIVALLIGWFKLREPEHSIRITHQTIYYHHRLGAWTLDWDNVQRIDCPRVRHGLDHVDLEAIGFRLKDYSPFLQGVSPRLATHILMEQRPLLMQNRDENCATGTCGNFDMFDDKAFTTSDGQTLTGVKAMLANRMSQLRQQLGFDVYVSAADLDRSPAEFAALMKSCAASRHVPVSE